MTQHNEAFIRALELEIAANTEHPAYDEGLQKALDFAHAMLVGGTEQQLGEALTRRIAQDAQSLSLMPGYAPGSANAIGFASKIEHTIHLILELALPAGQPIPRACSE